MLNTSVVMILSSLARTTDTEDSVAEEVEDWDNGGLVYRLSVTLIISAVNSRVPWISSFLSNRYSEAGSVMRARAAKVSMILIQSSWTVLGRNDGQCEGGGAGGDISRVLGLGGDTNSIAGTTTAH